MAKEGVPFRDITTQMASDKVGQNTLLHGTYQPNSFRPIKTDRNGRLETINHDVVQQLLEMTTELKQEISSLQSQVRSLQENTYQVQVMNQPLHMAGTSSYTKPTQNVPELSTFMEMDHNTPQLYLLENGQWKHME